MRDYRKIGIVIIALILAAFFLLGLQARPDNASASPFPQQADDRGQVVFETVCAACHSLTPPAKLAPPMLMVAGHYLEADVDDPWGAMQSWLARPSAEKSLLPAHAIERFGLMPPLVLPEEDAKAVIAYIKGQYDAQDSESGGMQGMHQMEGGEGGMQGMHRMEGGQGGMQGMRRMEGGEGGVQGMRRMEGGEGGMHRMHQMQESSADSSAHQCAMMGGAEGEGEHECSMMGGAEGEGEHQCAMMGGAEGEGEHECAMMGGAEGEGEHQCAMMGGAEGEGQHECSMMGGAEGEGEHQCAMMGGAEGEAKHECSMKGGAEGEGKHECPMHPKK